jgi:hypothetical protein
MKKLLFILSGCAVLLFSSCSKSDVESKQEEDLYKDSPSSIVPADLTEGLWFYGTISAISYFDRDGHELGNDYEAGREYQFKNVNGQGRMVFYQYLGTRTSSSCISEFYTYKEGTVKFESDKFTFYPVKGNFKTIKKGCSSNGTTQRIAEEDDLQPTTYRWDIRMIENQKHLYIFLEEDVDHEDPVFVYAQGF